MRAASFGRGVAAIGVATCLLLAWSGNIVAQEHDLRMVSGDLGSASSTERLSPDIRIDLSLGAETIDAVDILRRGVPHRIYPRVYIGGLDDVVVPSGGVRVTLYARPAELTTAGPTFAELPDPGDAADPIWEMIGSVRAIYLPEDGPFALRAWPDSFASMDCAAEPDDCSVTWTPPLPVAGEPDMLQVAAKATYVVQPEGVPAGEEPDVNTDNNVAVSLYETMSGLLDVVLVHDTSGSMGSYMHESFTYMQHARSKGAAFLAALGGMDRFAVVEFSTRQTGGTADVYAPGGVLVPAGDEAPTHPGMEHRDVAAMAIGELDAGGATPLGAGLERAIGLITAPAADPVPRKPIVLLLSDGYENSGTPRACNGADPAAPCVGSTLTELLQDEGIRAYTLGLGPAANTQCLQCLAEQSDGRFYATPPGIEMTRAYLHMQQDYTDDDLYAVDEGITGGGDDSYTIGFEGAGGALYFILAWDDLSTPLGMELKQPDGRWLDAGRQRDARVVGGAGWLVARVTDAAAGDWGYRVTGPDGAVYLAAVRSDRADLRLLLDARADGAVGDPIAIAARLTRQGQPVDTAELYATVRAPAEASFDSALREGWRGYIAREGRLPMDPALRKANPDMAPRAASVLTLTGGDGRSLVRERVFSVPLRSVGDGLYRAEVAGELTRISGTYRVSVDYLSGTHRRTQERHVALRPGPMSADRSFAELVPIRDQATVTWLLRAYPTDRWGNAVSDPGLREAVRARIYNGHLRPLGTLAADGALQQVVVPRPGRTPQLAAVALGGQPIHVGPVLQPDPGPTPEPQQPGRARIVLLLLALLLLWLWVRRLRSG